MKKYIVKLGEEEREALRKMMAHGQAPARQVAHAATWASAMNSSSRVSSRSCWADKKDRAVGQSTGIGAARALSSLPTEASSAAQRSQARRCWPATRRSAWSSSPSAKVDSVSKDRCAEIPTLPRRPKGPVCRLGEIPSGL